MLNQLQRYSFIFSFILILFVMAGCKKSKSVKKLMPSTIDYREIIALHSEIPDVMLGFEVDRVSCDKDHEQVVEIVYKPRRDTKVSPFDIARSYIGDMELLGWKQIGEFSAETIQLMFERPRSKLLCSVYIDQDGRIRVTLLKNKGLR